MMSVPTVPIVPIIKRKETPERADAGIQYQHETMSQGCDPVIASMRSAAVSAHYEEKHEINLSAKSLSVPPDAVSIGMSARPLSQVSVREQGDQVSEGRFATKTVARGTGTDQKLLEDYLAKPTVDCAVGTTDVFYEEAKPTYRAMMVQTEEKLDESNLPEEPMPAQIVDEPELRF